MLLATIIFRITPLEHVGVAGSLVGLGHGFGDVREKIATVLGQGNVAYFVGTGYLFLVFINLYWGLLNLLPIWPLDGGQAAQILLDALRSPSRPALEPRRFAAGRRRTGPGGVSDLEGSVSDGVLRLLCVRQLSGIADAPPGSLDGAVSRRRVVEEVVTAHSRRAGRVRRRDRFRVRDAQELAVDPMVWVRSPLSFGASSTIMYRPAGKETQSVRHVIIHPLSRDRGSFRKPPCPHEKRERGSRGSHRANRLIAQSRNGSAKPASRASSWCCRNGRTTRRFSPAGFRLLPLRSDVVFPQTVVPLVVNRPSGIRLIDDCMVGERMVGLVSQLHPETDAPGIDDLYPVVCVGLILKMLKFPDGSTRIVCQGQHRARLVGLVQTEPYLIGRIEPYEDIVEAGVELDALVHHVNRFFQRMVDQSQQIPEELQVAAINTKEPGRLADLLASSLPFTIEEKQSLLVRDQRAGPARAAGPVSCRASSPSSSFRPRFRSRSAAS